MSFYYDIFNTPEQIKENDIHTLNQYMYINPIEQKLEITKPPSPSPPLPPPPPPIPFPSNTRASTPPLPIAPSSQSVFYQNELVYTKPEPSKYFYPKNADPLFWCIYILLNGYTQYVEIDRHYGNVEMNEKQKLIEHIQKNPALFKNSIRKITKVIIQEIMSDLMTNKKTSFEIANAFGLYYQKKITFLYEKNKSYMVVGEQTAPNLNIYITEDKYHNVKWGIKLNDESTLVWSEWFCIENPFKPLKSIGYYKLNELEEMAKKYQFYDNKKKRKQNYTMLFPIIFFFQKLK